ncbi:hypothetical protein LUZ60_016085 [Juncus effusus]|nr:hypothetical protein LUZ60_016085 [Juncus effusus]
MPSVGTRPVISTRRSSRVSLPKPSAAALRSDQLSPVSTAKRENDVAERAWPCLLSGGDWRSSTVANGWGRASVGEPAHSHEEERDDKAVDIVYRRKRQRQQKAECISSNSNNGDNKRFGIVFSRQKRNKRPKLAPSNQILENGMKDQEQPHEERRVARLVLVVLVENRENIPRIFLGFLLSVLRWMRRNSGARIRRLISLLLNGPIGRVFSNNGVQFLSAREGKDGDFVPPHFGLCKLYSPNESIPILSLNFSSLPFYFVSLNLQFSLSSLYISPFLKKPSVSTTDNDDDDDDDDDYHCETKPLKIKIKPILRIQTCSIKPQNNDSSKTNPLSSPLPEASRTSRTFSSSSSFKRHHQKKRTTTPNSNRNHSSKPKPYFSLNSHRPKPLIIPPDDSSQSGIDSDVSTTPSQSRHKRSGFGSGSGSGSLKSPVMRIHERLALSEAKQNIDSVRLKANILVTLEDRCYREDDVILSIENSSDSDNNDWLICVTLQDSSKFRHKPSEMRPCVVNRFTHAYMWTVDDVMRLEFIEKIDWLIFKELHSECRLRNSQVRVKVKEIGPVQIPIPGVVEVENYEAESRLDRPFILPELYLKVKGDEVERIMEKEGAVYEADSGDERWIEGFNSNNDESEGETRVRVSMEEFEGLVSLFEKDAYVNVNNINENDNIDGVVERCKELERADADVVAAVFEYWMRKRGTKGGAPLIRFFQGVKNRNKRVEWCQKPYLKKKRSFKRQRSQITRLKSEPFFHDWAEEEANRRAQEAEAAANRACQLAIQMRNRAQALMEQADLATYRSFMAVRIADAKFRVSDDDLDPFPLP